MYTVDGQVERHVHGNYFKLLGGGSNKIMYVHARRSNENVCTRSCNSSKVCT